MLDRRRQPALNRPYAIATRKGESPRIAPPGFEHRAPEPLFHLLDGQPLPLPVVDVGETFFLLHRGSYRSGDYLRRLECPPDRARVDNRYAGAAQDGCRTGRLLTPKFVQGSIGQPPEAPLAVEVALPVPYQE